MRTDSQTRTPASSSPYPHSSEDDLREAFFGAVYRAFQQAEQLAEDPLERSYMIAGYPIRLRFAGRSLAPHVMPALEHLAVPPSRPPGLTVCLWDTASTDTKMPPPPWKGIDYLSDGEMWGFSSDRFDALFQPDVSIMNMLDSERNVAIFWVRDFRNLRLYEKASPLRTILYWWMRSRNRQMVHAAAVGDSKGGVLIGGKGGSGKSTASLACLHSGLLYVGDNNVLLSQESTPFAHSVYNSCTLQPANMRQRFPWLVNKTSNPRKLDDEKALLFLHEHYPESVTPGVPVKAILLPEIGEGIRTRVREISRGESLISLAPSSIFGLPTAGPRDFQCLASLVRSVPSYALELGTDLPRIPDVILSLLGNG